jgi:KaiC/GvpD/RAD55 family RecA-like ATPase
MPGINNGRGLLLIGPCGSGKTHLAVAALLEIIDTGKPGRLLFRNFQDLIQEIQGSFDSDDAPSKSEILRPLLDVDLLVLDELGSQKPSMFVQDILYYVINSRYNAQRTTIFTTNYVDDLDDRIGSRLRSRLYEMTEEIKLTGVPDYRKTFAQHHGHSSPRVRQHAGNLAADRAPHRGEFRPGAPDRRIDPRRRVAGRDRGRLLDSIQNVEGSAKRSRSFSSITGPSSFTFARRLGGPLLPSRSLFCGGRQRRGSSSMPSGRPGTVTNRVAFRTFNMDRWARGGRASWWSVFWIYNIVWGIGGLLILIPSSDVASSRRRDGGRIAVSAAAWRSRS